MHGCMDVRTYVRMYSHARRSIWDSCDCDVCSNVILNMVFISVECAVVDKQAVESCLGGATGHDLIAFELKSQLPPTTYHFLAKALEFHHFRVPVLYIFFGSSARHGFSFKILLVCATLCLPGHFLRRCADFVGWYFRWFNHLPGEG